VDLLVLLASMESSDPVELAEDIWENWYWGNNLWTGSERENPCLDCPNRDSQHYWTPKNLHPEYCSSSRFGDAEILIVGQEPGDNNSEGEYRNQLFDEETGDWTPEDHHGEEVEPSLSAYLRAHPRNHARTFLFYDDNKRLPPALEDRILDVGDYFYTNSKHCANTGVGDSDARDCCRTYLEMQIEVIDPDIVVPLGEDAYSSTVRSLRDLGEDPGCDPNESMVDVTLDCYSSEQRSVLPVYHWSYFYRRGGSIPESIRKEYDLDRRDIVDYYLILSEMISSELSL